jgi:hypothetical protein
MAFELCDALHDQIVHLVGVGGHNQLGHLFQEKLVFERARRIEVGRLQQGVHLRRAQQRTQRAQSLLATRLKEKKHTKRQNISK